jgi:hypothetical protein
VLLVLGFLKREVDLLVLTALLAMLGTLTVQAVQERGWVLARGERLPYCGPGDVPAFAFGFAALSDLLGQRMGRPLECEHPDIATGDLLQKTTTGLAVYRWCTNTPVFASGAEYWALTVNGPLHWTGPSADPPSQLPVVQLSTLRRPCAPGR